MQFDLIVRNGTVATGKAIERADIGVLGGKIAQIGDLGSADAGDSIDATGLTVLPGIIDTQVHFREPGMEHKEDIATGTLAALLGGVTTVLEMPNTNPPTTTVEAFQEKTLRATGRAWCHIGFFVGAATENLDQLAELEVMPGCPGIKLFMGSSTGTLLVPDDESVRKVLANGRFPMPVHSEDSFRLIDRQNDIQANGDVGLHPVIRDAETARRCTERLLRLASETNRPVHVLHISTLDELPLLSAAKQAGQSVTCEVTPQHLWFSWPEDYERLGSHVQMNPPIRSDEHRQALRAAVRDGLFDVFGSDHAPHTIEEKSLPYPKSPSGMPGVQTLAAAAWTLGQRFELFDLRQFVRMMCERPAELYRIRGKGFIEPGHDADLTIVDLNATWRFEVEDVVSKCGWSPYVGETFELKPIYTVLEGQIAMREGEAMGSPKGRTPEFDRSSVTGPIR